MPLGRDRLRTDGLSDQAIARRLDCSERTVTGARPPLRGPGVGSPVRPGSLQATMRCAVAGGIRCRAGLEYVPPLAELSSTTAIKAAAARFVPVVCFRRCLETDNQVPFPWQEPV